MPFDVNKFKAALNGNGGVARPAHFAVTMGTPKVLTGLSNTTKQLGFFCEATELPGLSLETSVAHRHGYGASEKMPFNAQFDDLPMSFIGDSGGAIWGFFAEWSRQIIGFGAGGTGWNDSQYEIAYKDDYVTDINIFTYDVTGKKVIQVTLMDAYPILLGKPQLAWSASHEYMRIPIQLTYVDWKKKIATSNDLANSLLTSLSGSNPLGSLVNGLVTQFA